MEPSNNQSASLRESQQFPSLLTMEEARQKLRISRWSLNRLIQQRELASIRIGRRRLVPMDAIERFIEDLRLEESA